ncbi:MAG: hypothetical protein JWP97_6260 [Labilithrix sp.]|nr:hypothetical protein [Labilithrix sp.]
MNAPADPVDTKASNAFTTRLYGKLRKTPGNLLTSGTSVRHALEIVYLGARGDTAKELMTALELPGDPAAVTTAARAEDAAWQEARGKSELVVANRLWADKGYSLKPDFTAAANAAFGAATEQVDFLKSPDAARRTINGWVSEQTAQKIPSLLPEGSVDTRTKVVVTNAIYFKGKWASPFMPAATKDEPFKGPKTAAVPTMHATSSTRFAKVGGTKVLELRYQDSQLAMLVVLPEDDKGLGKLEESMSADSLDTWTKALTVQRVAVSLPKFTFASGASLAAPLGELGVKTAFGNKADLSGVADAAAHNQLQLSQVVQKTWIGVDENGTEAAAATGAVMTTTSMPIGEPAQFKADHPFLFFVYDARSGRVLFAGRVVEPKAS